MFTLHKDEPIEIAKNKTSMNEEEFSFEIEELDSQHAMMLLIPLDLITVNGVHHATP